MDVMKAFLFLNLSLVFCVKVCVQDYHTCDSCNNIVECDDVTYVTARVLPGEQYNSDIVYMICSYKDQDYRITLMEQLCERNNVFKSCAVKRAGNKYDIEGSCTECEKKGHMFTTCTLTNGIYTCSHDDSSFKITGSKPHLKSNCDLRAISCNAQELAKNDDCEFYTKCLESKYGCSSGGDNGYPLYYGKKYCKKFTELKHVFPKKSQIWIENVKRCLKMKLLDFYSQEIPYSGTEVCNKLNSFAFGSHPECYVNNGFCELFTYDENMCQTLSGLYAVYDIKDFFSKISWVQIKETIDLCEQKGVKIDFIKVVWKLQTCGLGSIMETVKNVILDHMK